MSTKIFRAWRVPLDKLAAFIEVTDPPIRQRAYEHFDRLVDAVKPEAIEQRLAKEYPNGPGRNVPMELVRAYITAEIALDAFRDPLKDSLLSIECGFHVWILDAYAYIIPWGSGVLVDNLILPEWAEDFGYWDNVDRPKTMTAKQWEERGRIWDEVCLSGDRWKTRKLTHYVINLSDKGNDSGGELLFRYVKRDRTVTS